MQTRSTSRDFLAVNVNKGKLDNEKGKNQKRRKKRKSLKIMIFRKMKTWMKKMMKTILAMKVN